MTIVWWSSEREREREREREKEEEVLEVLLYLKKFNTPHTLRKHCGKVDDLNDWK